MDLVASMLNASFQNAWPVKGVVISAELDAVSSISTYSLHPLQSNCKGI